MLRSEATPQRILTVDIGGTKVKVMANGAAEARKMRSGAELTPAAMVEGVKALAKGWRYDAVSIGFPGLVGPSGPLAEPGNLGPGWVGFDYARAFGCPVRMANDAAMQALGAYEGGRMLFLGLGTGVGSALIAEHVVITLELGDLPYRKKDTVSAILGRDGMDKAGKKTWRKRLTTLIPFLQKAFVVDYVVLGGGNAKRVKLLPPNVRLGNNLTAFRGGFRLWHMEDVRTLDARDHGAAGLISIGDWRLL